MLFASRTLYLSQTNVLVIGSPIVSELQTEIEAEIVEVSIKTAKKNEGEWKEEEEEKKRKKQEEDEEEGEETVIWTNKIKF